MAQVGWQLQELEAVAKRCLVRMHADTNMHKLLNHEVASVFHTTYDRLRFFQRGGKSGWIHLLVVVCKVSV